MSPRADCMVVSMARLIPDGATVASGLMSWLPMLAILLARGTHAPRMTYVNCVGCINPDPPEMPASSVDVGLLESGQTFVELASFWDYAARGSIDLMFFGAAQVDAQGATNTGWMGNGNGGVKLPGIAGARALRRMVRQPVIFVPRHTPASFTRQADQTTTVATDSTLVVSSRGVFRISGGRLEIVWLHPGTSFEEVVHQTGFPVEQVGEIKTTAGPTAAELAVLARLDPGQLRYRLVES